MQEFKHVTLKQAARWYIILSPSPTGASFTLITSLTGHTTATTPSFSNHPDRSRPQEVLPTFTVLPHRRFGNPGNHSGGTGAIIYVLSRLPHSRLNASARLRWLVALARDHLFRKISFRQKLRLTARPQLPHISQILFDALAHQPFAARRHIPVGGGARQEGA